MADADFPDLGEHRAIRQVERNQQLLAAGVEHRRNRQVVEVRVMVGRLLTPLGIQLLVKVAFLVEQADADEGQAHVAGRLAVVAGQDAEPAGIDRQAFVQAELGAEIGDQVVFPEALAVHVPHVGPFVVAVVGGEDTIERAEEDRIGGVGFQTQLIGALEKGLGVVVGEVPQRVGEADEQAPGRPVPAVPEIVGQLLHALQRLGDPRIDFKPVDGTGHDVAGSMPRWM
ncbi:hypothetical protein D3C81_1152890 [compost metagenome]